MPFLARALRGRGKRTLNRQEFVSNHGKRTLDSLFATLAGSLVPIAVAVSAFAATVLATGVGLVALGWVKPASLSLVDRLVKGSRLFRSWGAVAATPAPTAILLVVVSKMLLLLLPPL